MTSIKVLDPITGQYLTVNTVAPSGHLYVLDADTGEYILVDLSNPSGIVTSIDADTGDFVDLDYSLLSGKIHVMDSVSGEYKEIDFSNPASQFCILDDNTGNFVSINTNTDVFFKTSNILVPSIQKKYSISGTVYDANGSTAVSGATVSLGAYSATSAANGTYTISDIPEGTNGSMTCTKSGYSWTAISVSSLGADLTGQNYTNAWWAAGGLAASCVAAYQPKGAASYAASKVNLVNPGTHNATNHASFQEPSWSSSTGWRTNSSRVALISTTLPLYGNNRTVIVKGTWSATDNNGRRICGTADQNSLRSFGLKYNTTNVQGVWINGTVSSGSAASGVEVYAITKGRTYFDGVFADSGRSDTMGDTTGFGLFDCIYNTTDGIDVSGGGSFNWSEYAIAVYSAILTDAQISAIEAGMSF